MYIDADHLLTSTLPLCCPFHESLLHYFIYQYNNRVIEFPCGLKEVSSVNDLKIGGFG